jgi:hypothetical protein
MIDDLSTRAALTLAAFLLLATGLSVLSLTADDAVAGSVRDVAEHVARQIDAISHLDAEATVRFGPEDEGGSRFPAQLGGRPFRFEIRATGVRLLADAVVAAAPLRIRVHPFPPDRDGYAGAELKSLDDVSTLTVSSDASFLVVRTARLVDGAATFLTFVRPG